MGAATHGSVIDSFTDVANSRYFAVSGFTWVVYDWILLFSDELELVGKSRMSLGKVLYYFSKILTTLGMAFALFHLSDLRGPLSRQFCVIFIFICPLMQVMSLLASYWLLMLRLVALYKSKPIIVWLLYISLFVSYAATIGLLFRAQLYFSEYLIYSDYIGLCITTGRSPTLSGVFYAPLGYEIILFGLTIYHAWKDYRAQSRTSDTPLLKVMYRDGVLLFCVMVAARIWNIIIYTSEPLTRTYLGIYMMWAAITAMSSRIYMNMVKLARNNAHQQPENSSSDSLPFPRKGPFPRVIGRPLPAAIANPNRHHHHNPNSISNGRSKTPKRAEAMMQPQLEEQLPRSRSRRAFYPNPNNCMLMGSLPATATATIRTVDSEIFYSAYFQDQFTMDQVTFDEDTERHCNVPSDV